MTKSHTRRGAQSQFQCQKTVTQHGGYATVFIYRVAISRRISSCVVFPTLLTIVRGWRAGPVGVALMKKKWTWIDLVDHTPGRLAALLWAHTAIVAVILIAAAYL